MSVVRALESADREILQEATLINLNWQSERFTLDDLHANPDFTHYAEIDFARGDYGFVVTKGGRWVSVVWVIFPSREHSGYGYVSEGVPELSVCVRAGHRRRGTGRMLMTKAMDEAGRRGVPAVSLSVEQPNPARGLYETMGFVDVPDAPNAGTMLVRVPL